ncbi:hypothetical protein Tco_0742717 [Tanacetum coccineum]
MDDPNMTMEEYIKFEEEKARRRGRVFNWQTATYGKIRVDDGLYDLRSVEAEFLAIVIDDTITPQDALPCKSQVSTLVNDEIDFRISFDESDDEDYTIICNVNLFSYKMISVNILKTDSENDNEKADEFNNETSVSEYDEEEQKNLYFNDIFPFNIIRPDDLTSEKDKNDNDVDIIHSSEGNEITHRTNKLMDTSCDKIDKNFNEECLVLELNVNIITWTYIFDGMLLCFIMNLYVPFGIPFDPKRYYKDGDRAIMLRKPRYKGLEYSDADIADFEARLARIYGREVRRVPVFNFGGLPDLMADGLSTKIYTRSSTVSAGRSQAPEKVIVADLFYLRGMDVDSFVAQLAEHFGLLTAEILGGLTVIAPELPVIDMAELRKPDTVASAPAIAEDAHAIDEGNQDVPAPVQAPQQPPPPPPPPAARIGPQRLGRFEEDV